MKDRFAELDALRGFAAIGVVFCHYSWCLYGIGAIDWTFNLGDLGPPLFFIVSGFVIFWIMKLVRRQQGVDVDLAFKEIPVE